jgi:hypothetical protein
MSRRLVTQAGSAAVFVLIVLFGVSTQAGASNTAGGNTSAGASAGDGQVTVQAGQTVVTPTTQGGKPKGGGSGTASTAPTYTCTQTVASPQVQQLLGIGGATPGYWVDFTCSGAPMTDPIPLQWVVATPAPVAINVADLALEAESKLGLASPTIESAPPSGTTQLVGVPTWLWIESGPWQDMSATATAGMVVATATAVPAKVVWTMGDGTQVTCNGPGTVYDPSQPSAPSDCSHTWTHASGGQPNGEFQVSATVYWQVAWTAAGAPGGGTFGLVAGPTSHQEVRVTESQAINTPSATGN